MPYAGPGGPRVADRTPAVVERPSVGDSGEVETTRKGDQMVKADDVCDQFAKEPVELTLRLLPQDREDDAAHPLVLIEGPPAALRFLAQLLDAEASDGSDGFQMRPDGAGSVHFSAAAELGVYIHRL